MTPLSDFAFSERFPVRTPGAIQLYSFPTPNGVKISIALEEMGLPYDAHLIDIRKGDQTTPAFLEISPNNKIPAIIDPSGPGGQPLALFESCAILIYLAEKSGKLLPTDPAGRATTLQWLMFQMGGVGPMFGQLGFFFAMGGKDMTDPTARDRFIAEAKRLLGVLNTQLTGREWVADDYSIADIALAPWVRTLRDFYKAGDVVGLDANTEVLRWLAAFEGRAAVQRGLVQPPLD